MKQKPCSKPFVAFLLSFFMLIFALLGSVLFATGSGSLSGGLETMVNSMDVGALVSDMVVSNLSDSSNLGNLVQSDEMKEIINIVSDEVVGAMFNEGGTIDSSKIEDKVMDILDSEIDTFLDDYSAEMQGDPSKSAADSDVLKELADKYNFDIPADIYDTLDDVYKESGSANSFKDEVKSTIDNGFLDGFKNELHSEMEKIEGQVNQGIADTQQDLKENSGIDIFGIFEKFETVISIIKICGIVLLVLTVLMFALQFIIYKKGIYGVFRNGAIVMFIAAIPLILIGASTLVTTIIFALPGVSEGLAAAAEKGINIEYMIENFINSIVSPFRILGIVYIVLVVIFAILAFALKPMFKKKYPATAPNVMFK